MQRPSPNQHACLHAVRYTVTDVRYMALMLPLQVTVQTLLVWHSMDTFCLSPAARYTCRAWYRDVEVKNDLVDAFNGQCFVITVTRDPDPMDGPVASEFERPFFWNSDDEADPTSSTDGAAWAK